MTRSGVASLAFFLPPSRPPGLRVLMLDKVTNLFDFWTRLPLSASFDDESTASIGPLSSADLAKLDCGEIDLARTCCGIFRHRAIRISFERFQGPQCRRRALWYTAAFLGFQIFLGVLKAAGAPAAGSAMIFSGPLWYTMLIYLYLFFCAWLIYAMPKLARGRLRFLDSPRTFDFILCACVLVYLLMVPRLYWDGSDVWGLIPNFSMNPAATDNFKYMTIAVSTVIAAGGAFYNPLLGLGLGGIWLAIVSERNNALCEAYVRSLNTSAAGCSDRDTMRVIDAWPQLIASLVVVAYHESTAHLQFTCAVAMQRMAARRIEQLGQEKERLDYERRMEGRRLDQVCAQLGLSGHAGEPSAILGAGLNANDPLERDACAHSGVSASSGSVELKHIMSRQRSSSPAHRCMGLRPALGASGLDSAMCDTSSCSAASQSLEVLQLTCAARDAALERTLSDAGLLV